MNTKTALIDSLDTFTRAYLVAALWSSTDESYNRRKAAQDAGYTVHSEDVDGTVKWTYAPIDEDGDRLDHSPD